MKDLSIVMPYYNVDNTDILSDHIKYWLSYSNEHKSKVTFIIVDDCSPNPFPIKLIENINLNIEVYRITQDIFWNVPGAKNLGSFMAKSDWMYHSYFDYILPKETVEWFMNANLDQNTIYWPTIYTFQGKPKGRHLTCMFIYRNIFWDVGGYDEDFAGYYGYDDTTLLGFQLKHCKTLQIPQKVFEFKKADLGGKIIKRTIYNSNYMLNYSKDTQYGGLSKISKRHLRFTWESVYRRKFK